MAVEGIRRSVGGDWYGGRLVWRGWVVDKMCVGDRVDIKRHARRYHTLRSVTIL